MLKVPKNKLLGIFERLDEFITAANIERRDNGGVPIARAHVKILGQMSLLTDKTISAKLELLETGDLDAFINTEYLVLKELRVLLAREGLIYDELSSEVWIPPGAKFEALYDLSNIFVEKIDAESALLSKAIKAKEKNRILIQEVLAEEIFPELAEKIIRHGGELEYFLETKK